MHFTFWVCDWYSGALKKVEKEVFMRRVHFTGKDLGDYRSFKEFVS